jgi:hypothetical protein
MRARGKGKADATDVDDAPGRYRNATATIDRLGDLWQFHDREMTHSEAIGMG